MPSIWPVSYDNTSTCLQLEKERTNLANILLQVKTERALNALWQLFYRRAQLNIRRILGGITTVTLKLPWYWRGIAGGAIYISATLSEGSIKGEGFQNSQNWPLRFFPTGYVMFCQIAPHKMAAVSKVFARCRRKVPGATKNSQSAINQLC